ncbi:MAG TPA: OPT/YSL family transporter [Kofleriaceae bacterium]|nr:OPT/YSL family transporter [Kofleriaceae bacterium]
MTEPRDRELTVRAVAWGLGLGVVLAAANVYAGLKIAFVDAGATTIILLSFAAFGGGARRFTAREANVAQVVGCSASTMAVTAGLIGPIPALALSGRSISPLAIALWGSLLAVVGTLVALPFRATLIEVKRLEFPSARAAGELVRNLFDQRGATPRGAWLLAGAAAAAIAVTIARDGLHAIAGGWMLPLAIAGVPAAALSIGAAVSPLLIGAGLLAGPRAGLSMWLGAAVAWLAIAPRLPGAAAGYSAIVSWTLWPGAALMIASSLTGLVLDRRALAAALRMRSTVDGAGGARVARATWLVAVAAIALIGVGWYGFAVHPAYAAVGIALSGVFAVAAMQATGETDTTPAGALGGVTQLVVGGLGAAQLAAPIYAGGTANGVAAHSATMLNAWKAGASVGATPSRLVAAQLAGIAAGAVSAVVAYWLIRDAYGLGGTAMPVPGAASWKVTAEAVVGGTERIPPGAAPAAILAAAAGAALTIFRRHRWVPSPIAAGVGFILPMSVTSTFALAAIGFAVVGRRAPAWLGRHRAELAAGLIVGESIAGVAIAAILVARG